MGVRTNLPPLVDWVNEHPLSEDLGALRILTNLEDPASVPKPYEMGFRREAPIRVQNDVRWV